MKAQLSSVNEWVDINKFTRSKVNEQRKVNASRIFIRSKKASKEKNEKEREKERKEKKKNNKILSFEAKIAEREEKVREKNLLYY